MAAQAALSIILLKLSVLGVTNAARATHGRYVSVCVVLPVRAPMSVSAFLPKDTS